MGLWPFGRKKDDMSVEALLEEANAASPTGPATAAAGPPDVADRRRLLPDAGRGHLHHLRAAARS